MRSCLWAMLLALLAALISAAQVTASDATPPDPRELLRDLNQLSINSSQVYFLRDARITRDRLTLYFNRGFLGLLASVDGEITGAAFLGDGEALMMPPDSVERQSLVWFTQSPVLDDRFASAYLRFTEGTAEELLKQARPPDPEAAEQPPAEFVPAWNDLAKRLNPSRSLRILEDLVSDRRPEYFSAAIQGLALGDFNITIDQRRPEAVDVESLKVADGVAYADTWCSFPSKMQAREQTPWTPPLRVRSYRVDTHINPGKTTEGHAELELESLRSERFLTFNLSRHLQVTDVRDDSNASVQSFQAASDERPPSLRNDWVAVVLPRGHPPGETFHLSFTYQGNVVTEVGNGVLSVGAHESWYPNTGPSPDAKYELTFEYPDRRTLVATGSVDQSSAQGYHRSRWVSDGVFPLAGFNLGPYDSRTRDLGHTQLQVFATPEAEVALERRYLEAQAESEAQNEALGRVPPRTDVPHVSQPLAPEELIDKVADSAAQAVAYFETLFGRFPYPRLAISQIPGDFGQGWPELVICPLTLSCQIR